MKHSTSFFSNSPKVRILSWWGYLENDQHIAELSAQCNTPIEIKEYMSLEELPKKAAGNVYDIYIYPWGYHESVQPYLPPEGPDITALTAGYHPDIRARYQSHKMPKDSLFFQHAALAYVYDTKLVPDLSALNAERLFALAEAGHVYLMDEFKHLHDILAHSEPTQAVDNWHRLYQSVQQQRQWRQGTDVGFYFSNLISGMLNPNLVLGVIDSGELINPNVDWGSVTGDNPDKRLGFGLHPKISQVNSDIIAVKTHDEAAVCVAKAMGSREFLRKISNENFYFSPFEESIAGLSQQTAKVHQDFYQHADSLQWTDDRHNTQTPNPEAFSVLERIRQCRDHAQCDDMVSTSRY